jgi:hypothetical protein
MTPYGFDIQNTIPFVSTCRDELACSIFREIDDKWRSPQNEHGVSFSVSSLGGMQARAVFVSNAFMLLYCIYFILLNCLLSVVRRLTCRDDSARQEGHGLGHQPRAMHARQEEVRLLRILTRRYAMRVACCALLSFFSFCFVCVLA